MLVQIILHLNYKCVILHFIIHFSGGSKKVSQLHLLNNPFFLHLLEIPFLSYAKIFYMCRYVWDFF